MSMGIPFNLLFYLHEPEMRILVHVILKHDKDFDNIHLTSEVENRVLTVMAGEGSNFRNPSEVCFPVSPLSTLLGWFIPQKQILRSNMSLNDLLRRKSQEGE